MDMTDGVQTAVRILLFTGAGGLIGTIVEWCMRRKYGTKAIWNVIISFLISGLLAFRFPDYMTIIKGVIFLLILLIASNSDIHTHEAANELSVMIAICGFIGITELNIPSMLAGAVLCALPQVIVCLACPSRAVGGADIKMSAACGLLLGITRGVVGLIIALLLSIVISLFRKVRKDEKLPLIPYLAAGFMAAYFI